MDEVEGQGHQIVGFVVITVVARSPGIDEATFDAGRRGSPTRAARSRRCSSAPATVEIDARLA